MTVVIRGKAPEKSGIRFKLRRLFGRNIAFAARSDGVYSHLYRVLEVEIDGRETTGQRAKMAVRVAHKIRDMGGIQYAAIEMPEGYGASLWAAIGSLVDPLPQRAAYFRMLPAVLAKTVEVLGARKGETRICVADSAGRSKEMREAVYEALLYSNAVSLLVGAPYDREALEEFREEVMDQTGGSLMITDRTAHLNNVEIAVVLSNLSEILRTGELPDRVLVVDFDADGSRMFQRPNVIDNAEIRLPPEVSDQRPEGVSIKTFTDVILAELKDPAEEAGAFVANLCCGGGTLTPARAARISLKST